MDLIANTFTEFALWGAGAGLATLVGGWLYQLKRRQEQSARLRDADRILDEARREADSMLREARLAANEETLQLRERREKSDAARREELLGWERRLAERETVISRQLDGLMLEEQKLRDQSAELQRRSEGIENQKREAVELVAERRRELERIAQYSIEEAKAFVIRRAEEEASREAAAIAHRLLEEARHGAEQRARQIISLAIQRYAGEHTFESTTATVALTGDDIKGRIIGREGRNIRAFEAATGVTVLIDDTPNAVVLSGFDPVRRQIAREAMERLIQDGRIHPTRIEEVVAKVSAEMEENINRSGEDAVMRAGIPPMHPEIVKHLGRLRYRHSFSQNILDHSVEVAHLCGLMAAELGVDVQLAKRAGLLHDIGKAINHEVEGSHALIGADLVKRFGECESVVNGVASHHEEVPFAGPFGILVSAADAISAARPGARSETMTTYLKRVESLERIAVSYKGVEKAYAVQAGRELRVMVRPEDVNDEDACALSRNIARQIESELQYPGQIRVIVVRETRSVDMAK
ncbi:MAG TPA: ribonuclease Y [Verrucomicrobiales bacterium]|nr:ribonuclease Y [Verrucomicrobiales bacterium]